MAEFVDVIRQFHRMCEANVGCVICPLRGKDGESEMCSISAFVNNPERIEGEVMSWAAEHPEPVYPTWGDWFAERGDLIKLWRNIKVCSAHGAGVIGFLYTTIPADIAQKLGIEPKEGV